MPDVSTHPTAQQLALFGQGKLSGAQVVTVATHLETCADCQKAVAGLPPDSLLGKVRAARPGGTALPPGSPTPDTLRGALAERAAPVTGVPPELADHPKFRIIRELGRGGMGVIYLAEHRVMDKPVALKVISPAVLDNPDAVARFLGEVQAAGKLDHANIARAHDADQAGELHFLVMEYVEGMSLAQVLQKRGPLPIAHACHYARQAALGLQHAFEKGMVHRDIKPHNLMLAPKNVVKVLDFGLARLRGPKAVGKGLTQADAFMGTPAYVAPEQAADARSADIRADIYSLGCTLYALLTGRPPFQEGTMVKLVLAHIEKEPRPLHEVRPDVPAELSAVVAQMLAKDPAKRFQKPAEVAQALLPFTRASAQPTAALRREVRPAVATPVEPASPFAGLEDEAVPPGPPRKAAREGGAAQPATAAWWKRPAALVGAGAAAALALVGGIWLLASLFSRGGAPAPVTARAAPVPPATAAAPQPRPGETVTNFLGMKLAWIPPGDFLMGGTAHDDEKPVHRVTITRGFYLGAYPVTQAQWRKVMGRNPSGAACDDCPVDSVSWDDCAEFCKRLKQRDGKPYRLPTEAEWEYACRAGTTTDYYSGNAEADLRKAGWYSGNSGNETHPVGLLAKNAWGLYDMHGSVWQWCADWYDAYPAADVVDYAGPPGGDFRLLRGGSYISDAITCRAACRIWYRPATWNVNFGCRVCYRPD
jgi:formylglycine-generating enzyme required for sulfatase activity